MSEDHNDESESTQKSPPIIAEELHNVHNDHQSLGYTPFNETNMMSMMMMTMMNSNDNNIDNNFDDENDDHSNGMSNLMFTMAPPPSHDDDDDNDEWDFDDDDNNNNDDDDNDNRIDDCTQGAFYANLKHFDNNNDDSNPYHSIDYQAIADQALKHLNEEYTATITSVPTTTNDDTLLLSSSPCDKKDVVVKNDNDNIIKMKSNNDKEFDNHDDDDNNDTFDVHFDTINVDESSQSRSKQKDKTQPSTFTDKNININKDAITKAMNNIRLKASSNFITKLDGGISKGTVISLYPMVDVPSYHQLIPSKSLLAFQRGNTEKSIDATARMTRSATLANSIIQYIESRSMETAPLENNGSDIFIIHIIGSDHVECASKDSIQQAIGPFVQWWYKASNNLNRPIGKILSSFRHLKIEFLGPNIPVESSKQKPILLFPDINQKKTVFDKQGLQTATVNCQTCLYHDYLKAIQSNMDEQGKHYPNFIVAYNAGIWGYDDWIPTLKSMNDILPHPTPFVITSYTIQEAEDDAEVVLDLFCEQKHFQKGDQHNELQKYLVHGPLINSFGSRRRRETMTSPDQRPYFENGAWQLWLMG